LLSLFVFAALKLALRSLQDWWPLSACGVWIWDLWIQHKIIKLVLLLDVSVFWTLCVLVTIGTTSGGVHQALCSLRWLQSQELLAPVDHVSLFTYWKPSQILVLSLSHFAWVFVFCLLILLGERNKVSSFLQCCFISFVWIFNQQKPLAATMAAWTTTELNVLLIEYKQKLTRFVAGQRRRRRQWNFLSLGTPCMCEFGECLERVRHSCLLDD
jgi:hypothetical protein